MGWVMCRDSQRQRLRSNLISSSQHHCRPAWRAEWPQSWGAEWPQSWVAGEGAGTASDPIPPLHTHSAFIFWPLLSSPHSRSPSSKDYEEGSFCQISPSTIRSHAQKVRVKQLLPPGGRLGVRQLGEFMGRGGENNSSHYFCFKDFK